MKHLIPLAVSCLLPVFAVAADTGKIDGVVLKDLYFDNLPLSMVLDEISYQIKADLEYEVEFRPDKTDFPHRQLDNKTFVWGPLITARFQEMLLPDALKMLELSNIKIKYKRDKAIIEIEKGPYPGWEAFVQEIELSEFDKLTTYYAKGYGIANKRITRKLRIDALRDYIARSGAAKEYVYRDDKGKVVIKSPAKVDIDDDKINLFLPSGVMLSEVINYLRPFRKREKSDGSNITICRTNSILTDSRRVKIDEFKVTNTQLSKSLFKAFEQAENASDGGVFNFVLKSTAENNPKVSITLRQFTLDKVINFVTKSVGFQYSIDGSRGFVFNPRSDIRRQEVENYTVTDELLMRLALIDSLSGISPIEVDKKILDRFKFEDSNKTDVFYDGARNLRVRTTPIWHDRFQALLRYFTNTDAPNDDRLVHDDYSLYSTLKQTYLTDVEFENETVRNVLDQITNHDAFASPVKILIYNSNSLDIVENTLISGSYPRISLAKLLTVISAQLNMGWNVEDGVIVIRISMVCFPIELGVWRSSDEAVKNQARYYAAREKSSLNPDLYTTKQAAVVSLLDRIDLYPRQRENRDYTGYYITSIMAPKSSPQFNKLLKYLWHPDEKGGKDFADIIIPKLELNEDDIYGVCRKLNRVIYEHSIDSDLIFFHAYDSSIKSPPKITGDFENLRLNEIISILGRSCRFSYRNEIYQMYEHPDQSDKITESIVCPEEVAIKMLNRNSIKGLTWSEVDDALKKTFADADISISEGKFIYNGTAMLLVDVPRKTVHDIYYLIAKTINPENEPFRPGTVIKELQLDDGRALRNAVIWKCHNDRLVLEHDGGWISMSLDEFQELNCGEDFGAIIEVI